MSKEVTQASESPGNLPGIVKFPKDRAARDEPGLRVLMVSPEPFFRARGTPFSVLHRIRGLLSAGHSVRLVTYPFGRDVPIPDLEIVRCARPPLVSDVKIGPSVAKLVLDVALYLAARREAEKGLYDVLHSHEEAAFFGVGLARRHGMLHVYDMHSSLPQQLNNFRAYDWKVLRAVFSRLEEHVLRYSDGVITVCPELATVVEGMHIGGPHAMIENTADDTEVFGTGEQDVRDRWGLGGKRVVLYTGTLEAYQGIDLLISAVPELIRRISDLHVLIVGGRPNQIESYRRMAAELGVHSAITFAGTHPPSEMPAFAKSADVIVSPRFRGTNTPGKIYGYLRAGRAIVATDHVTHTQVLDNSIAHLVTASPRGLVEGLSKVLLEPEYAEALASAAKARAEERYSDAAYLLQVKGFYEEIAKIAKTRRPQTASL